MSGAVIDDKLAAKLLRHQTQWLHDEMDAGRMDIGYVKPRGRSPASKNTYIIFRAKFNRLVGMPPDYVWPEEREPDG